ncbi:MAG TPA: hypothetical protein VM537_13940 [Anaerolineae bacterium]|nr:hypothetical protein [Anaerolineae bacterium]
MMASDQVIYWLQGQDFRNPVQVLLVAAALLHEQGGRGGGFLGACWSARARALQLLADDYRVPTCAASSTRIRR